MLKYLGNNVNMTYLEFLETVKVLKMLYGRDIAERVLTANIHKWYNIDSESLIKMTKGE